jgi:hypothetical protein
VKLLIEAGADINHIKDRTGETALQWARSRLKSYVKWVKKYPDEFDPSEIKEKIDQKTKIIDYLESARALK